MALKLALLFSCIVVTCVAEGNDDRCSYWVDPGANDCISCNNKNACGWCKTTHKCMSDTGQNMRNCPSINNKQCYEDEVGKEYDGYGNQINGAWDQKTHYGHAPPTDGVNTVGGVISAASAPRGVLPALALAACALATALCLGQ